MSATHATSSTAATRRDVERLAGYMSLRNLANLVAQRRLEPDMEGEERERQIESLARQMFVLFGRATEGFDDPKSPSRPYAELFIKYLGKKKGEYIARCLDTHLHAHEQKCVRLRFLAPFKFEPKDQRSKIAKQIRKLASRMEEAGDSFPKLLPKRAP